MLRAEVFWRCGLNEVHTDSNPYDGGHYGTFLVFPGGRKRPQIITYLGTVLPYGVMAMLVIYCLKGVSLIPWPHGIPELLAVAAVVGLHLRKKNTLLSIFGGTAFYMLLVQVVFA